jgi:hypothetical protein
MSSAITIERQVPKLDLFPLELFLIDLRIFLITPSLHQRYGRFCHQQPPRVPHHGYMAVTENGWDELGYFSSIEMSQQKKICSG